MDLFVSFIPQKDGIIAEKVILACDNNTSKIYTLTAKANMVEIKVISINQNPLLQEDLVLNRIHFDDIDPSISKANILSIKNYASVKVNYEWDIKLDDKENPFNDLAKLTIEPEKGVFQGDAIINFKLTYVSKLSIPFYRNITLIINDIPFQGIRNPPDIIKKQFEQHKQLEGGSSVRPNIKYFEFEICGITNFNKVMVEPSIIIFPTSIIVQEEVKKTLKITNLSNGNLPYSIELHGETQAIRSRPSCSKVILPFILNKISPLLLLYRVQSWLKVAKKSKFQ